METKTMMISDAVLLDEASLQEIKGGINDTFPGLEFPKDNNNNDNTNSENGCTCNCRCK